MRKKEKAKEISDLSNMISRVVLKDNKIREKFAILIKKGVITKRTVVFFLFGGDIEDKLFGNIVMAEHDPQKKLKPAKQESVINTKRAISLSVSEQIDGRKLTPKEYIFQEMVSGLFDEKEWLKKAGLRW